MGEGSGDLAARGESVSDPDDEEQIDVPPPPDFLPSLDKEARDWARDMNRIQGLPPKGITRNSPHKDAEVWVDWAVAALQFANDPSELTEWRELNEKPLALLEANHPEQYDRLNHEVEDIYDTLKARYFV